MFEYRDGVIDDLIVAYTGNTYGVSLARDLQKALVLSVYIKGTDVQDVILDYLYNSEFYSTTDLHDLVLGTIRQTLIDALDEVFDVEIQEGAELSQIITISEGLLSLLSIELSERAYGVLFSEDIEKIDKVYLLLEDVIPMDIANMSILFTGTGHGFIKIMQRLYKGAEVEETEEKEMSHDTTWINNYLYSNYPSSSGVFLLDYGVDTTRGMEQNFSMLELLGKAHYTAENIFTVFLVSGHPIESASQIVSDFVAEKIPEPEEQLKVKNGFNALLERFKDDYSRRAA